MKLTPSRTHTHHPAAAPLPPVLSSPLLSSRTAHSRLATSHRFSLCTAPPSFSLSHSFVPPCLVFPFDPSFHSHLSRLSVWFLFFCCFLLSFSLSFSPSLSLCMRRSFILFPLVRSLFSCLFAGHAAMLSTPSAVALSSAPRLDCVHFLCSAPPFPPIFRFSQLTALRQLTRFPFNFAGFLCSLLDTRFPITVRAALVHPHMHRGQ